uniref:Carboxylic ester hydrolase n=1 Tax=Ascaris lumbricoides TaxID=6252 RepID=A0A0M3IQW8_ASCLU
MRCKKGVVNIFLGIPYAKPPVGPLRFKRSVSMNSVKASIERLRVRESQRVCTKTGEVQGFGMRCKKGVVNIFLGIPYAKPPIGPLRFKKTEPVDPWSGVLMCTKYRSRCPQKDFIWDKLELRTPKSEDCLYLNIMAPSWKPPPDQVRLNISCPDSPNGFAVMFYIHGGGYLVDSAVKYRYWDIVRLLSPHDVIVVTIQYRLGYLGYFSTADENCIGNFGLWDQVTALKWVSENIKYFGGDPKSITVAGQSAGAASADLLSLSPYSRGKAFGVLLSIM